MGPAQLDAKGIRNLTCGLHAQPVRPNEHCFVAGRSPYPASDITEQGQRFAGHLSTLARHKAREWHTCICAAFALQQSG